MNPTEQWRTRAERLQIKSQQCTDCQSWLSARRRLCPVCGAAAALAWTDRGGVLVVEAWSHENLVVERKDGEKLRQVVLLRDLVGRLYPLALAESDRLLGPQRDRHVLLR